MTRPGLWRWLCGTPKQIQAGPSLLYAAAVADHLNNSKTAGRNEAHAGLFPILDRRRPRAPSAADSIPRL
jgi:hypothetical protein